MTTNYDNSSLRGRVALVTGGGSGIGQAIAMRLARAGAEIVIISLTRERVHLRPDELKYFPSTSELEQTQRTIQALGVRCMAMDGDITIAEDVEQFIQATLDTFDHLDILVNNAATSCVHPILEHPVGTWMRIIEVNLVGAFRCIRAVLPHLIDNGWGRIVNIGSTAATVGFPDYSAYCASKHGLLGLTRSLSMEVADKNITANLVSPASVETPSSPIFVQHYATKEDKTYEAKWDETVSAYPQKRLITPEEVAELVYYLTRDEAQAINGEDFRITMGARW